MVARRIGPVDCKLVDTKCDWFSYTLIHNGQTALRDGYVKIAEGAHCEVWIHSKALEEFLSAPDNDRARAERIINHISEQGPELLNDKQFKQEGRYPSETGKVVVCAVKSYQLRIYGGWLNGPSRVFLCPEATIKKTNKADSKQLKRVASKVGEK